MHKEGHKAIITGHKAKSTIDHKKGLKNRLAKKKGCDSTIESVEKRLTTLENSLGSLKTSSDKTQNDYLAKADNFLQEMQKTETDVTKKITDMGVSMTKSQTDDFDNLEKSIMTNKGSIK